MTGYRLWYKYKDQAFVYAYGAFRGDRLSGYRLTPDKSARFTTKDKVRIVWNDMLRSSSINTKDLEFVGIAFDYVVEITGADDPDLLEILHKDGVNVYRLWFKYKDHDYAFAYSRAKDGRLFGYRYKSIKDTITFSSCENAMDSWYKLRTRIDTEDIEFIGIAHADIYNIKGAGDPNLTSLLHPSARARFDNLTKEESTMKIDMKTLMMLQMMNANTGDNPNPLGSMMPLLLLSGDAEKIKIDRALLLNAIPNLADNERQSIAEGKLDAAVTSILAREMSKSDNPLSGIMPFLLMSGD